MLKSKEMVIISLKPIEVVRWWNKPPWLATSTLIHLGSGANFALIIMLPLETGINSNSIDPFYTIQSWTFSIIGLLNKPMKMSSI